MQHRPVTRGGGQGGGGIDATPEHQWKDIVIPHCPAKRVIRISPASPPEGAQRGVRVCGPGPDDPAVQLFLIKCPRCAELISLKGHLPPPAFDPDTSAMLDQIEVVQEALRSLKQLVEAQIEEIG